MEQNYTLNYWLNEKHAPNDKTLLGVAFYGRSFTLENPNNADSGSKAIGSGIAGPITKKPGLLAFNEVRIISNKIEREKKKAKKKVKDLAIAVYQELIT